LTGVDMVVLGLYNEAILIESNILLLFSAVHRVVKACCTNKKKLVEIVIFHLQPKLTKMI